MALAPQYHTNDPTPAVMGGGQPAPAPAATPATPPADSGVDWSSILSTVGDVAPYAATGALGYLTANRAAGQDQSRINTLTGLGQPYMDASGSLLRQSQAGKLTPDQQSVVDLAAKQGQDLINAASPLASIANTGFQQYQAGQLQPGQQQQLDAWLAAQKAQLKQTLGSSGISDSTILATQGAAIDAQGEMMKQQMMQQNLGVADSAFTQWLTATQAGQKVQMDGKIFAVSSLDNMLNQALNLAQVGMQPIQNAVQLGVQSDAQLSQSISQLMQGVMTAYAIHTYNQGGGKATGGGVAGGVGTLFRKMFGGGASGDPAAGAGAGASPNQGVTNAANNPSQYEPSDPNATQSLDSTSLSVSNPDTTGYQMNPDMTVNTDTFNSYFYDPSATDLPSIDFSSDGG